MSNENQEARQELVFASKEIEAYDPYRAQLAELKAGNAKAVFDYRSVKGDKEARSHIYKLRQTKGAIEQVRVKEKESVLLKGRKIDAEAKEITKIVDDMIAVHETPLLEIKAEEDARIEKHKSNIQWFSDMLTSWSDSVSLQEAIDKINLVSVDSGFEEFETEAHRAKQSALENLNARLQERLKYEAEQAELARLRAEAAQREQKEREEQIAKEAAENARIAAEKAAEYDRQRLINEQTRKGLEAKAAIERAEREKLEAENARLRQQQEAEQAAAKAKQDAIDAAARAEREKQAAIEAERKRQADAVEAERLETERRERNKAHVGQKRKEAKESLMAACGVSEEVAKAVVLAIANGKINNVSIAY